MRTIDAARAHLPRIEEIYGAEVAGSAATFDLEHPPLSAWERVLEEADPRRGRFLLVAVDDSGVLGFARSGRFRDRAAYDSTCETSIYLDAGARGRGIGTTLYRDLLERLDRSPLRLAVAGLTEPNPASARLHLSLGFERVGTLNGVGVKFGRPWDVTWYQRRLLRSSRAGEP